MPSNVPITHLLDRIGKRVGTTAVKHPALVAGGVGVGLGVSNRKNPAKTLEQRLTGEMMGAPQAKYSSCSAMEKFAFTKITLEARRPLEKVAGDPLNFVQALEEGLGKGVGAAATREGVGGLRRLLGSAFQFMKEKLFTEPKRRKMVGDIVSTDPTVKTMESENPGTVQQAYKTMARFAPTISTDPNLATSFLRNAAMSGGALDYQVVKGLADAESAVQRAQNEGAWLRGGF